MTTNSNIGAQYLKHTGARFLIFVLVFYVTLKLAVSRSRPPVPYGANLFYNLFQSRPVWFDGRRQIIFSCISKKIMYELVDLRFMFVQSYS